MWAESLSSRSYVLSRLLYAKLALHIYIYIYIYYTPAGLLSIVHSRSVSIPVER